MAYSMKGCSYNYPGGPKNPFVDEMATKPKSPKKPKK